MPKKEWTNGRQEGERGKEEKEKGREEEEERKNIFYKFVFIFPTC